jgi:hypothetical protein
MAHASMVAEDMMTRSSGLFFMILHVSYAVPLIPVMSEALTSSAMPARDRYMLLVRALHQSIPQLPHSARGLIATKPRGRRTMITLYRLNSGSIIHSLNNIPSVRYLILVRSGEQRSSNRIEYPT